MPEPHDDALARLRADFDQSIEATRDFAKQVAAFRSNLIENGIPKRDATELTAAYVTAVLGGLSAGGSGGGDV